MIEKTASVHWNGQGKRGVGQISTGTGALKGHPHGIASRFEDDCAGAHGVPAGRRETRLPAVEGAHRRLRDHVAGRPAVRGCP